MLLCKNRRSALRSYASGGGKGGGACSCAVEVPPREKEWRWIYEWHPDVLECTPAQLDKLLNDVAMKYHHTRSLQLDGMLGLLATLNARGPVPAGVSISTGGFLVLYALFTGQTQCRVYSANSSQTFASLALAFYAELKEPSLLRIEAAKTWAASPTGDGKPMTAGFHLLRIESPSTHLKVNGHGLQPVRRR